MGEHVKALDHRLSGGRERQMRLVWTADEDPSGLIADAAGSGRLTDALMALGDPAGPLDALAAQGRLSSVLWLMARLQDRADLLTVAVRDQHRASWGRIADIIADAEGRRPLERSTVQGRYRSSLNRLLARKPAAAPTGSRLGAWVRVLHSENIAPQYRGRVGVVTQRTSDAYRVAGLTGPIGDTLADAPWITPDRLELAEDTTVSTASTCAPVRPGPPGSGQSPRRRNRAW